MNLTNKTNTNRSNKSLLNQTMNLNFNLDYDLINYMDINQIDKKIYAIRYVLITYVYPVLIIFGILGNSFSFLALSKIGRTKIKSNRNFTFCLATLCLTDMCLLVFGCLREYLEEVFRFELRAYSIYTCRFFFCVCYLFSAFSSYLYALIAYDRWNAIKNPFTYKQNNRVKENKKRILFIFCYCILISWPFAYFVSFSQIKINHLINKSICELSPKFYWKLTILDAALYCILPFSITFLFSVITLAKLVKKKYLKPSNNITSLDFDKNVKINYPLKRMRVIFKRKPTLTHAKLESKYCQVDSIQDETSLSDKRFIIKKTRIPSFKIKRSSNVKTTTMLLTLPISYLMVTMPPFAIMIIEFIDTFTSQNKQEIPKSYENEFALAKTLMYGHNSFNILFFMLVGQSLRLDLKLLFMHKKRRRRAELSSCERNRRNKSNVESFKSGMSDTN